jgi:hypothetical protein
VLFLEYVSFLLLTFFGFLQRFLRRERKNTPVLDYYFLPGNRPDELTGHLLDIRAPTVIPGNSGWWDGTGPKTMLCIEFGWN